MISKVFKAKGDLWVPVLLLVCLFCFVQKDVVAQQLQEPEMVYVTGGSFTMGCTFEQGSDCNTDEKPSHTVKLTGFAIAKYEVTQSLWKQVMGNNPSRFKGDSLPVENVTWDEVQIFLQRLNAQTGKNYRLPTEAEWEYAARGGQQSRQTQYAGGVNIEEVAWCNLNSENQTHPVGTKQPNELGLYDMSGNVWEWCSDYYGTYSSDNATNPKGPTKGSSRVLRGGCYASINRQERVSIRKSFYQGGKDYMTGFRLAMDDDREARAAAAAAQAEQERIAAEKAAADAAKKAEQERIAAEKAAADAAKKAEQERIAAERAAEQERMAAERAAAEAAKKAEQERIAAEKAAERERIAAERAAERERIAAERAAEEAAAEAARIAEQKRIEAEWAAEQARRDSIAAVKAALREEHQREVQHRRDSIRALPFNTFFTLNVACSGIPQWSYGFKVGQVRKAGWYVSLMTNFNFKGAFSNFDDNQNYVLTGKQKTTRLSATVGLVVRPCKPMSIMLGAGFGYRSLNIETTDGWRNYPKRTFYGPEVAFGFMFHAKWFVLTTEVVAIPYDFNHSEVEWHKRIEGKLGIGFMLPNKKKNAMK